MTCFRFSACSSTSIRLVARGIIAYYKQSRKIEPFIYMQLWKKLLDSKSFIVFVLTVFAIALSAIITLSKSVEIQSLQEQKSLTPALSLVVQEIMKPLYVAETITKVSPLKNWLNDSSTKPEQIHNKLTELSQEFDMDFFVASEKTRLQYNSDGSKQELIEGKVEWYFRDKQSEEKIIGALGNRQDIRIYYDIKVFAENGEFLGFIGVSRRLKSFLESFNQFKKKFGYDFVIADHKDNIVLSSDESLVADGKRIMSLHQMSWFNAMGTEFNTDAKLNSLLVNVNGSDYLIAEADLEALNWQLFIVNPLEARQMAATKQFIILAVYIFVLLTIVAFVTRFTISYFQSEFAKKYQKDPLTQLPNRAQLNWRFDQVAKSEQCISVVIVDIDHFKAINDNYGHASGDLVLQHLASILSAQVRHEDVVARWGGEEFVLMLAGTKLERATQIAEKARLAIAQAIIDINGHKHSVTASFGVATSNAPVHRLNSLIARADKALYEAKDAGRNKVRLAPNVVNELKHKLVSVN